MDLTRTRYLEQIRPFYESDLIKVLTGVRRSGKSVLLNSIKSELQQQGVPGSRIVSINLEDLDFSYIQTANDLDKEIKSRIQGNEKHYIFLDEIQHVENFEKALASLRAKLNASIFVTGSNSRLLSGELATLLTGRTVEFEIFPFSFIEMKEYFELNGKKFSEDLIYDYIKWGGFPVRFDFYEEESTRRYLENLYTGIVGNDLLKTSGNVQKKQLLDISLYILANAGRDFSAESIAETYNAEHATKGKKTITSKTVCNYLDRLERAFLIHKVKRFDIFGKRALKSKEKFYAVDTGLRIIQTNSVIFEDTFFLENIVYNELRQRGYTVYIGKTYKGEVDFIAIKNGKKCFIQVAYLLASESTIQREFGAFSPIHDASPKYVISLDKVNMSRNGIAHINLVDFLLQNQDLQLT